MILSRIRHPNIVQVLDADIFESSSGICGFFTMEFIPGGSLEKFRRSFGDRFVPVETSVELIKQICRGLSVAHRNNPPIIHRDIKPQNILVGYEAEGLRARISDFGLAKKVNPLTLMATAAGTITYKPPEIFKDMKGDSPSGDVWAIGTTLYLLLTDKLPFSFLDDLGWGDNVSFDEEIIASSEINPDVNKALDKIIIRAMKINPKERYPSAKEMLEDLETWNPSSFAPSTGDSLSSESLSKGALGRFTPINNNEGQDLAKTALEAKNNGHLAEAADLMEEAFNKCPELREQYATQVKLWRSGISM
jgi:serine/threonine-protein kinase